MMNILSDRMHARNFTDFQDFTVVPVGTPTFEGAQQARATAGKGRRRVRRPAASKDGLPVRSCRRRECAGN